MKLVTLVTLAMSASLAASAPLEDRAPAPAPSRPAAYGGGFGAGGGTGTADMNGSSNSTNGAGGVGAADSGNNWSAAGAGALTKTGVKVTKRLGGDFGQAGIAANSQMGASSPQQQQQQAAQQQQAQQAQQQQASSNQRTPMASQSSLQSQGHRHGQSHGQSQGASMGAQQQGAQQASPMGAGAQQAGQGSAMGGQAGGRGSAMGGQAGGQGAAMGGQGSAMGGQAGGRSSAMGGQAGGQGSAMGGQAGGQGAAMGGQAGGQGSALGGQAAGQGSAAGGRGAAGIAARQEQQQPGASSGSQSSPFIGGNASGDARGPSPGAGAAQQHAGQGHHSEKNPGIIAPMGQGRRDAPEEQQAINVDSPSSSQDKDDGTDYSLNHPNSNGFHQGSGSSTSIDPSATDKGDYHSMDNFSSVVLPDTSKSTTSASAPAMATSSQAMDSASMKQQTPSSTSSAPRETASMSKADPKSTSMKANHKSTSMKPMHDAQMHQAKPTATATHHQTPSHAPASKRPQKTVFETTYTTVTTTMHVGQPSPKKHGKESWQQEKNEDLRSAAHDVQVAQSQADDNDDDEDNSPAASKTMAAHAARDKPGESDKKNAMKIKADSLNNADRIKAEHASDRAPERPIPHFNQRDASEPAKNGTVAMHHNKMANATQPAHHKMNGTHVVDLTQKPHAAMNGTHGNATQPTNSTQPANATSSAPAPGASGTTQTMAVGAQSGPQYGGTISNPFDNISSTFSPDRGSNTTINGHKYPGAAPKQARSSIAHAHKGGDDDGADASAAAADDAAKDKETSKSTMTKDADGDDSHKKAFEQGRQSVKGAETEYPEFQGLGNGRRDADAPDAEAYHRPHLSASAAGGHPHAESDFASSGTDAHGNPVAHVDMDKVHHAEDEADDVGEAAKRADDPNDDGFTATLGKDGRHPSASSSYGGTKLSSSAGREGASAGIDYPHEKHSHKHGHEAEAQMEERHGGGDDERAGMHAAKMGEKAGKAAEEKAEAKAHAEEAEHGK